MSSSPPAFMAILLRIVLPKNDCRRIVGELEAEYHEMMPDQNRGLRGTLWYWREGISLLFAYSTSRLKRENPRDISVVLDARRYRRQTRQQARGNDERGSFMESMSLNIRYALRSLLRDPRYLLTAVLTLALGIGANTAIFTVLNGVVLKPLDYEQPGQLVRMNNNYIGSPDYLEFLTGLDFIDVRDQSESFEYLAAFYEYRQWGLDLTGGDRPRRVIAMPVSSDYFSVLSCEPLLGRNFTREEERYDNLNIIISHKLWQQHFEGDPDAIGETIMLDRELMTVVGVLPSDFREPFGRTVDVWMAHNLVPGPSSPGSRFSNNSRDNYYLSAIGRLQPGVSIEMARAELAVITSNIDREYPDRDPWQFSLIPLNEAVIGGSGKMLYILLAAVGLVLLIACVNVANLSLVRGAYREREFAIRSALGSGRSRLVRQMLTENLLTAVISGLAGFAIAFGGVKLLLLLKPDALPRLDDISFDLPVFTFALALSLLTSLLFGLIPAMRFSRTEIERSLRETGRTSTIGIRHRRVRAMLVISQIGLALILLICSALLIQSFVRLRRVELGIETNNILTFDLSLPASDYSVEDPSRRIAFYETYREKVRAIPGVRFAGEISRLPITGEYHSWGYLIRSESEETGEAVWHLANIRVAGGDYFEALGIDLLHGRTFTAADHLDAPAVVLVNKAFADRYFTDSDPVGEQVWVSGWREIAGVVSDIRIGFRTETPDKIYLPYNQFASDRPWVMAHVVAGEGDRNNLIESIRSEISAVDPGLIIFNIRTMNEIAGSAIAREQFALILMTIFAAVALGLAIMGIYGVLSYVVSQRHQEIGIRMALGAHNKLIRRLIIREGLVLTTAGIASGIIAALILTRWLDSLLFEVSALDSFTFIFAALLLGIVAWAACFIPAIRATRTDPVEILHSE